VTSDSEIQKNRLYNDRNKSSESRRQTTQASKTQIYMKNGNVASQGLVFQFEGGGARKGIVGIVAGMVGIEGIVVGMVGKGVFGSGGSVNVGRVG
jgi:hypothetical protein